MSCVKCLGVGFSLWSLTVSLPTPDNDVMVRVLLLVDDYRELVFLQTLLKKTGFDVDGTQNGGKYEEMKLTLNPELIIASSRGKTINGLKLAEDLKRHNDLPRFVLIVPHKMAQKIHGLKLKNVDGIIDSPIDAKKLLVTIAKVCGLDSEALIQKLNKMMSSLDTDNEDDLQLLKMQPGAGDDKIRIAGDRQDSDNTGTFVAGEGGLEAGAADSTPSSSNVSLNPSSISDDDRQARMQKAIDELETPEADGFASEVVDQWNRRIRTEEKEQDLEDLEDERQRFVKSLFKKS